MEKLNIIIAPQEFNEANHKDFWIELAEQLDGTTLYYLNVQEARPLSNAIAEQFQVKHESPQALLFVDGELKWHASHWTLTYDELKKQWEA